MRKDIVRTIEEPIPFLASGSLFFGGWPYMSCLLEKKEKNVKNVDTHERASRNGGLF